MIRSRTHFDSPKAHRSHLSMLLLMLVPFNFSNLVILKKILTLRNTKIGIFPMSKVCVAHS